jgi:hypothetical protein
MIGIRPGEKIHETLITEHEARRTKELENTFVILPEFPSQEREDYFKDAPPFPAETIYVSNHPDFLFSADAAAKVLKAGKIPQHDIGLVIELPKKLSPFIVEKGSIALNGVSLTIANVGRKQFTVMLIPYTLKHTNLGMVKSGDLINIEVDMMTRGVRERGRESEGAQQLRRA